MKVTHRIRYGSILWLGALLVATACASSKPTFDAPEIQLAPIPIPVPPAELACQAVPHLAISAVTRAQVEADGSVLIVASTQDILNLVALVEESYGQCQAHNRARATVIEAERIALEELERLRAEIE